MSKTRYAIYLLLLAGCNPASELSNHNEIHRHLDAQGGWYGIDWGKYGMLTVKHDVDNETYVFKIYSDLDGVTESITNPRLSIRIWERNSKTKKRGFTNEMSPELSLHKRQLEKLADQLWDASATP